MLVQYLKDDGITDLEQEKLLHIGNLLRMKRERVCRPTYVNDLLKAHKTMFNCLKEDKVKAMRGFCEKPDYRSVRNRAIMNISEPARVLRLSRPTVYKCLKVLG